jgi:hypothetical protein
LSQRSRQAAAATLVALVALLPFLRGALSGASLYFRDLSLHFFPLRRFALEGLRHGELRLWNPYVHEGVPLSLPALGYPLDLLGIVSPNEAFLSLLLALHVPLGAVFFFLLARGLGLRLEAAGGGALVYALGGFFLSSVNLYVYVEAAAWAPLVVLCLVRLPEGGRRALAGAALVVAVALSTTGVEIVAQAIAAGAVLGLRSQRPWSAAGRLVAALGLGAALAAPVLVLVASQLEGSARGRGFPTEVVLAHSIHPFALVQTVVGSLFGNPANLANEWWGQNFFPRGFPYVLSLYLGASVLALAVTGATGRRAPAGRLLALLAVGLVLALGRWGGLTPLVEASAGLRVFRFPVKAFFTVHLAVALLASLGLQALADGRRRLTLALVAFALGALLVATPLLPHLFPGPLGSFAAAFFPPGFTPETRAALLERVLRDAATGGAVALAVALVAFVASRGRLSGSRPAWLVAALVAADLLRTGAGLNPMVSRSFYTPSAELGERLPPLREGRVYTCPIETSPAFHAALQARGADHELWSFALLLETLSPAFNVPWGVATALSPDLTMLVPTERILLPEEGSCTTLAPLLPRLREAAVSTVLSLDPLDDPDLAPLFVLAAARTEPVAVHAYALRDPLPRFALTGPGRIRDLREGANRLELTTEAERPTTLVVRDAWAGGWSARVDGRDAEMPRRRHRELSVPAGSHRVVMSYAPPGLGGALVSTALALALVGWLWRPRPAWRRERADPRVAT